MFTIFVAPPAEQQLRTFAKPLRTLFVKRLHALRTSPRPPGVTKFEGMDHLYRIREGGYRIIYAIREKDLIVLAIKNGHRTESSRS
ncbi:MAG: type II toxin-antitoxin system RelE/ParE family toxin [Nitrospirae bacterium]|nr:type II toxin-antitoxin system RelE/ParE family toxin [Nitrospirota bacterium]